MTDPEQMASLPIDGRHRATRRLVGVALLAMLLVGVLIGILLDRFVPAMQKGRGRSGPPPGMMGGPPRRVDDVLARDLGLTPVQRSRMDSIMTRHIREFEAVRADVRPRMQQIIASMRAEMDSVLTLEQRTRMHERFARARRWRPDSDGGRARMGRPGGSPSQAGEPPGEPPEAPR